jgi:hypothetical protein
MSFRPPKNTAQWCFLFLFIGLCQSFVVPPGRSLPVDSSHIFETDSDVGRDYQSTTSLSNYAHNKTQSSLYLISLEYTPDDERISKPVRDVWKWKDSVLGDGRDFFVPKPKTILALQEYILKHCPAITEISVISNCARFEVLFRTSSDGDTTTDLVHRISRCLAAQVLSSKKGMTGKGGTFIEQFSASVLQPFSKSMDIPSIVLDADAMTRFENSTKLDGFASEISSHWTCVQDVEAISRHLCWIAAGIAIRPRRPDRAVPFRPFSSRDAHILLRK